MLQKKTLSVEPKKKKVIKKKKKKPQGSFRKAEKKVEKPKKEKQKSPVTIVLLILAVLLGIGLGAVVFRQLSIREEERRKEEEAKRRVEAFAVIEEARAKRRAKEYAYEREQFRLRAEERIKVTDGLQAAWEELWLEEIPLTAENENTFATIENCLIFEEDTSLVRVNGTIPGIPQSDSDDIYLFALNTYETSIPDGAEPADTYRIEKTKATFEFFANLNNKQANSRMFKKFVVAAKVDGKYKIISRSRYITNPEAVAKYNVYTAASSIKGLLVDPNRLNSGELEDLGVKQAAYNIPLSKITGQTTSANYPTIHYTYNGRTYAIDGQSVAEYDIVFGSLSRKGIRVTAIILNDMNYEYPELVHPQARSGSTAPYVMFNGTEQAGIDAMAAMATFLAERYSGSGHGTVSNWIIANEINARKQWNYMEYTDVYTYSLSIALINSLLFVPVAKLNGIVDKILYITNYNDILIIIFFY